MAHPNQPSLPTRHKADLQKEYREKEAECINKLRGIVKDITGEELRKRLDVLRRVIDILTSPEFWGQGRIQANSSPPTAHGAPYAVDHSTQSSQFSHWEPSPGLDVLDTDIYDPYFVVLNMDIAPDQPDYSDDIDWSNYRQA